ncbi:2-oxoglutarate and iron-dependent oxygenase domain-containing protein [Streptomyces sp. NPDC006798]|uniref:isopenicillin N synthase family dioxygenase n=1 Tax=Streptomyces sp. NPDC006798 TaxID=3155462 RepID=UPI0033E82C91
MRIPTIDLELWAAGGTETRRAIAETVDEALRTAGFLLVRGHGIDASALAEIRAAARRFFHLPRAAKQPYAVQVGGRGWLGPGAEANAYAEGGEGPPDLKESFAFASYDPTGDPVVDAEWFDGPNVWPAEVPAMRPLVEAYLDRMRALSDGVLEVLGVAIGGGERHFTAHTGQATWGFNINWYPGTERVGPAAPGQFRIGPHTDFGTVTLLDRQPGLGGLQVYTDEDGWQDAPYDPDALTMNIGDLMAHWSGGRWRAGRHRVLPPPLDAPDEELISLAYFYDCDLGTDVGGIDAHAFLRDKLATIIAD